MAAISDPLEIVPLADMRLQLRASDTSDNNSIITANIKAAVGWLIKETGRPILRVTETYSHRPCPGKAPLLIRRQNVTAVTELKYWDADDDDLRSNPTGSITTFGRLLLYPTRPHLCAYLYPEDDEEFPKVLDGSVYELTLTRGIDFALPEAESLKQALILVTREFYEGRREIASNSAIYSLISSWVAEYPDVP